VTGPPDDGEVQLAEAFAEVARSLLAEHSVEETLRRICSLAVETIDGCDHAGISLITSRRVETHGASDEVPELVDFIQYESSEGPCLDAIRDHEVFHVNDLEVEERWPNFARRAAAETGVRSMLSFRLFAEENTMGALNLYSRAASAFDAEADRVGAVFAAHAAVALKAARQSEAQAIAIETRDVIGQAKGILMARQGISEPEAFEVLRQASQRLNVKLRDVAEQVSRNQPRRPA